MSVVLLPLLFSLTASQAAPAAAAAPESQQLAVDFRWDAPEAGCPDQSAVRAELERLLGRPVGVDSDVPAAMTAIARVRQEGETWDLRLWTVRDGTTRFRVVTAQNCELVAQAGALIAAMAIDPEALTRGSKAASEVAEAAEAAAESVDGPPQSEPEPEPQPEPEPALEPESEPLPQPASEPQPAPEAEAPSWRRPVLRPHLLGGLSLGSMPGLGAMAELGIGVGTERVSVELGALTLPAYSNALEAPAPEGASIDLHLAAAALRGCYRLRLGERARLPLCGGAELGALIGVGRGYTNARPDAVPWVAFSMRPALQLRIAGPAWFAMGVEGTLLATSSAFEIAGLGEAFAPGRLSMRAFAGIALEFGSRPR